MISHSLYFQSDRNKQSRFMVSQVGNKKPQIKITAQKCRSSNQQRNNITNTSETEDSVIESTQSYMELSSPNLMRPTNNQVKTEVSSHYERLFLQQKRSGLIFRLQKEESLQAALPKLAQSKELSRVKPLIKPQKLKPLARKQSRYQQTIQLNPIKSECCNLIKGIQLRCIYNQARQEKMPDKLLIINFENVMILNNRTFWEYKSEVTLCNYFYNSKHDSSNSQVQCISAYCPCQLRQDLKQALKLLSKYHTIVFIFNNYNYATLWHRYMVELQFNYDAIYQLKATPQVEQSGIKFDTIIKDFNEVHFNRIIYIDTMDQFSNTRGQYCDSYQCKLPIIENQLDISVFYFQSNPNYKSFDCKFIVDLCNSIYDYQIITSNRRVLIQSVNMSNVYEVFAQQLHHQRIKQQILKDFQYTIENQSYQSPNKPDSIYKWVDHTRNSILESLKNRLLEKIPLLHFTVGDCVVRNHTFRELYYNNLPQINAQQSIISKLLKINQCREPTIPILGDTITIKFYFCTE